MLPENQRRSDRLPTMNCFAHCRTTLWKAYHILYVSALPIEGLFSKSRVHQHWKKIYRVDFFAKANSGGLTNYVIRHNSK